MRSDSESVPRGDEEMCRRFTTSSTRRIRTAVRLNIRTTVRIVDLNLAASAAPIERADAARNRRKVLAAAEGLFATRGVAAVSMDDVAAAAGVGKGTLYRRFGD